MTTAILVQARTGSTRLPGKVLQSIGSRTVFEEVIGRCLRVRGVDVVAAGFPISSATMFLCPSRNAPVPSLHAVAKLTCSPAT